MQVKDWNLIHFQRITARHRYSTCLVMLRSQAKGTRQKYLPVWLDRSLGRLYTDSRQNPGLLRLKIGCFRVARPISDFPEQLIVTLLPSQKSTCSHCSPKTSKEQFHQVQWPQPASLDESQNSLQLGSLENMLTQRMEASWATASSTSCSPVWTPLICRSLWRLHRI